MIRLTDKEIGEMWTELNNNPPEILFDTDREQGMGKKIIQLIRKIIDDRVDKDGADALTNILYSFGIRRKDWK